MNHDAILILETILGTAVSLYVLYYVRQVAKAGRRAYGEVLGAMRGIGDTGETNKALLKMGEQVVVELSLLRTLFSAQGAATDYQQGIVQDSRLPEQQLTVAYPRIPTDMFHPVPDAKEEDTEVMETTDAGAAEQEQLEETRGRGFEAEE